MKKSPTTEYSDTKPSDPVLVLEDIDKIPHNLSYMKLVCHGSLFQRPHLHLLHHLQILCC